MRQVWRAAAIGGGVAIAMGGGLLAAAPVASAQAAGGDGRIVYEVFEGAGTNSTTDIWIMDADGTGQTNLTPETPDSQEYDPELSPDGTRVAFISNRVTDQNPDANFEIFVVDSADGANAAQVTVTDNSGFAFVQSYDPTWSPDGTQLSFSGYRAAAGSSELYRIDVDGSDEVRLSDPTDFANKWEPDWSPDGSVILFTWGFDEFSQDLHTVAPDGTAETNLTPGTVENAERNPQWSPDGTRIAFRNDKDPGGIPPNVNAEIYVMEYPSLVQTRVTDDPAVDESPTWSLDGSEIVFSSLRSGGGYDLYTVPAPPVPSGARSAAAPTGSRDGATPLNTGAGDQQDPTWGVAAGSPTTQTLTVTRTGRGIVRSTPAGIACGTDCSQVYTRGTTVTLRAKPAPGWTFTGWSGACTGAQKSCTLAVNKAKGVKALFTQA